MREDDFHSLTDAAHVQRALHTRTQCEGFKWGGRAGMVSFHSSIIADHFRYLLLAYLSTTPNNRSFALNRKWLQFARQLVAAVAGSQSGVEESSKVEIGKCNSCM